jgi:hypothetical protein
MIAGRPECGWRMSKKAPAADFNAGAALGRSL